MTNLLNKDTVKNIYDPTSKLVKTKMKIFPDGSKQLIVYDEPRIVRYGTNTSNSFSLDDFLTPEEIEDKREYERKKKFFACKTKIKDYVLCNEFTHFWNLTQDEKIVGDRFDDDIALSNLSSFLYASRRRAERNNSKFNYLIIPERHKNGALHFHGFTSGFVGDLVDSGCVWKGKTVFNCKQWKYGFSDVTEIIDKSKAASYCTKYITKDLVNQGLGKNKKKYWSSRGLREPEIVFSSEDLGKGHTASWSSDDGRICIYKL